jgi:hypothetical protein
MQVRNPLRSNYYNTPSLLKPGAASMDSWRRDPMRNPAMRTATDDDMWIEESRRRADLAQRLLAQQNARRERDQADLLEQALQSGNANLFDEPANDQDAELQGIMQQYLNAGMRGVERQWSPQAIDRQRKMAFENLAANRQARAQALDESQFIDQKRRTANNFALEAEKAARNDAYRQNALGLRQKQMQYDALMDLQRNASAEAKQAMDLVKDGMDPEEVIGLFKLSPRDQQLLRSYSDMGNEEDAAMLELLNRREQSMRTPLPEEEESWLEYGLNAPGRVKDWAVGKLGAVADAGLTVAELAGSGAYGPIPGAIGAWASNRRFSPAQMPKGNPDPYLTTAAPTGEDFDKMMLDAAQSGYRYDPRRGFYADRPQRGGSAGGYPRQVGEEDLAELARIPLITSKAQYDALPPGTPFRTLESSKRGRAMRKGN